MYFIAVLKRVDCRINDYHKAHEDLEEHEDREGLKPQIKLRALRDLRGSQKLDQRNQRSLLHDCLVWFADLLSKGNHCRWLLMYGVANGARINRRLQRSVAPAKMARGQQ